MASFTFLTEFRGGTYIGQHQADTLRSACTLWKADVLAGRYIQALDPADFARVFDTEIDELPPVAIEGVAGVWLFVLKLGRFLLSVHVVAAAPDQE